MTGNRPQIPDEEHRPNIREEAEAAVKALKMGKSAGMDTVLAELAQAGEEAMIERLTLIYKKILKTGEWPTHGLRSTLSICYKMA